MQAGRQLPAAAADLPWSRQSADLTRVGRYQHSTRLTDQKTASPTSRPAVCRWSAPGERRSRPVAAHTAGPELRGGRAELPGCQPTAER